MNNAAHRDPQVRTPATSLPTASNPGAPPPARTADALLAAIPPLFILIWATGYVVAKAAAGGAEPLTFLLLRYCGVALLMVGLAVAARVAWPGPRQTLHLVVAGLGMQAGYLGGVWVAIAEGMPAGVAALIVNLQPVLTAALGPWIGERLAGRQWAGIALGFGGVLAVVWEKVAGSAALLAGPTVLCVFALLAMTLGTLYQKRFAGTFDLRAGQAIQAGASIVATLPLVLAFEHWRIDWTPAVIGAMLWSIAVLTGAGVSLIFVMLRRGRATTMTSYMYLVPAVTALLAWAMFGETLSLLALAGMAVTVFGIYLVVARPRGLP